MFDLGFSELLFIGIVALIVLGPERLPKAARFAGLWMRRARTQWHSVKSEFENEIADEQLRNTLKQTRDDLREARDSVARGGQDLQREFTDMGAAARDLDNTPAIPSPAEAAAVATGTEPAATGAGADARPVPGAVAAQSAATGDNDHLDELDDEPWPDGLPGPRPDNAGPDGQR